MKLNLINGLPLRFEKCIIPIEKLVMTKQTGTPYSSQLLRRVMQILSAFSEETPKMRFSELQEKVGLHKSTLFRLLEDLREHGLLSFNATSGVYQPGMRLFEIGLIGVNYPDIHRSVEPVLEELSRKTSETAHFCVLDGTGVVYLAKVDSSHPVRIPSWVGRRNFAYCTGVGKAILAYLPEGQLQSYFSKAELNRLTPQTITSEAALRDEFKRIRTRGYATDDQEHTPGIRCVAAPVRDYTARVIGAISVAGPQFRIPKEKMPRLAQFVITAAQQASERFGFIAPPIARVAGGAR
jgi:DNA-binding IclR family transcriptional regulator